MMTSIKFDIEKFDGKNDFGLWQVRMKALLEQQGLAATLEELHAATIVSYDSIIRKKAYNALILCLGNQVLREITKERTISGIWKKLKTLYMTQSLANRFYLKKKLHTFHMHPGKSQSEHIDEFYKLVSDLTTIDTVISYEDQALLLLTSSPSSYDNFVDTLLYGRDTLTLEDVLATLNSRELQKMAEAKGDGGVIHVSGSGADEYDNIDIMMAMSVDELLDWIIDSEGSYHMIYMRDHLVDFDEYNSDNIFLSDGRECRVRGTGFYGEDAVRKDQGSNQEDIEEYEAVRRISDWVEDQDGIKQGMLEPIKVRCIFLGYRKGIVGNKALEVLQGVEFEVEPQEDHTFEVEPHGNVDHVAGSQEVQNQDLLYNHLAHDKEQHSTHKLFSYREDSNEIAFAVVVMIWMLGKMCMCSATVARNAVTIAMAITGNIHQAEIWDTKGLLYKAKEKCTWYEDRQGSECLSGDYDVEINGKWSCIYAVGSQEYQVVCTRLDMASANVGMLDKIDRGLQTNVLVFMEFDYAMGRSINVMGRSITRYGLMILGCTGS
ncbi:hypothetical protein Tco_0806600 [Tanacetum coccineum]